MTATHLPDTEPGAPEPLPDRIAAARFLVALDPQATGFTFQTFDDDGGRKRGDLARILHGSLADHWTELAHLNAAGAGIFVAVNATDMAGRKSDNITRIRALFVDLDGAPLDPVTACSLPPHITVESSPGRWHCYWVAADVPLEQFGPLQRALATRFDGDGSVHDLPRVLRLPGFLHRKAEPFRSVLQSVTGQVPYTLAQVLEAFPPAVEDKPHQGNGADRPQNRWGALNERALADLAAWVPIAFPTARKTNQGYRVASADLGRGREEDLSLTPRGCKYFGDADMGDPRGGRRSPLDVVMEFMHLDLARAAAWLEQKLDGGADDAQPEGDTGDQGEAANGDTDAEIARLAQLPLLDYDRERKEAAATLGVRASILDRLVKAERDELGLDQDDEKGQGHAPAFPEIEPWPDPIDGAELLDEIVAGIRRYVVLSDASCDTTALWAVHAHMPEQFAISPRLGVRSPTKGCGKTLLFDVIAPMVPRPLPTANVTPAAVFRVIELYRPTLLIDEADTFLRKSDELRGVLNSGHRKGGQVLRTVGDDHEPRAFSTYAASAIALIGSLPDTLHDRAVAVDLKRRLKTEKIESFRCDRVEHLKILARKAARWAADNGDRISELDPKLPDSIVNREADNWRPLIAIADAAGGKWPERARKAAEAAHAARSLDDESSLLEILLGDIKDILAGKGVSVESGEHKITSADLVEALVAIEGRPWAEFGKTGKPLTANRLAKLLRPLGIGPDTIKVGSKTPKGYFAHRFKDAFARFCPEGVSEPQPRNQCDEIRTSEAFQTATKDPEVAVGKCEKSNNDGPGCGVAVAKWETSPNAHTLPPEEPPGLSGHRIRELADWYLARAEEQRLEDGAVDQAELDLCLLQALEAEVLPEHVETEFERVVARVFAEEAS